MKIKKEPSINLIMTFEPSDSPLGTEDVMELIEKYFDAEASGDFVKLQFGDGEEKNYIGR